MLPLTLFPKWSKLVSEMYNSFTKPPAFSELMMMDVISEDHFITAQITDCIKNYHP